MIMVPRPHAHNLVAWAKDRPDVVVLSADLTASCEADLFRDAYPDRFFSMGMAEQNMIGVAAGLAREGYTPCVHTFAVFITRRAFDQVAMAIAYPNLRVRLFGFLPGITTPGGVTHQAIDDIALMRAIPNMHIIEVGDATEVESALDVADAIDGPVYLRMLRGEVPRLFPPHHPLQANGVRDLGDGDDITLVSSGICTQEAMAAAKVMRAAGLTVQHLHVSTLKPFPADILCAALRPHRGPVLSIENHSIIGGLGSALAEVMAEAALARPLVRLGLRDTYAHGASTPYLMAKLGIDTAGILAAAGARLGVDFSDANPCCDTDAVPAASFDAKPEAL